MSDDDRAPIYQSVADVQLERRVAALERLAETRDVLDRTEALAARRRRRVEQSRTDLLEKISRVQDDLGETLSELTAFVAEQRAANARIIELLTALTGRDPNSRQPGPGPLGRCRPGGASVLSPERGRW
ncbi:hypothetical protein [Embleya sp. NPDC050493]|uniref:hypothetical protein n=1 Tax=Embleya sp. NPDC050493 TaxID=3363989 RepID=UPI0037A60817